MLEKGTVFEKAAPLFLYPKVFAMKVICVKTGL